MQAVDNALAKGTSLHDGEYKIKSKIDQGGFGITYRATTSATQTVEGKLGRISQEVEFPVAIKEFFMGKNGCVRNTSDGRSVSVQGQQTDVDLFIKYRQKFIDEAEVLAKFKDVTQVVRVLDFFRENDTAYMVMEFIDGQTLAKVLDQQHPDRPTTLDYIRQIAEGLKAVHAADYIHRDVKPTNIMIDRQGRAVLIDFGGARDFVHQHSQTPILTPGYAPLEQYARQVNHPTTDIYALTATLYRCWFGKAPADALKRKKDSTLDLPSDLEAWQKSLFERGLALEAENRIQNATQFLELSKSDQTILDLNDEAEGTQPTKNNTYPAEDTTPEAEPPVKEDTVPEVNEDGPEKPKPAAVPPRITEPKLPVFEPPKKKSPLPWLIAAIVLLSGGIWGYTAYQNSQAEQRRRADQAAYNTALTQNDSSAYAIYLQNYPTGLYTEEAKTKLDSITSYLAEQRRIAEQEAERKRLAEQEAERKRLAEQEAERLAAEQKRQEQQDLKDSFKKDLVYVKGGTFTMGCTAEQGDDCYRGEKPTHRVTLSSFYISKYEVTQGQWEKVMGSNPSRFKNCGENCPVENVSWNDIQDFLRKLNQMTGENYRLPTEAQWEFAARGGTKSRSYKYAGSNRVGAVAWYDHNSGDKTHPVGQKEPNELGLYDMSGNVMEWCADWSSAYSSASQTNPTGPSSGSSRILRGGGWYSDFARRPRVPYRNSDSPGMRYSNYGFRLFLFP